MIDDTKKHGPEDHIEEAVAAGSTEDGHVTTDDAGMDSIDNGDALLVLIDGLKAENGELKDKYLRLAAEMDNLRRRTERDVKDARTYSVANFARDMLTFADNLGRVIAIDLRRNCSTRNFRI